MSVAFVVDDRPGESGVCLGDELDGDGSVVAIPDVFVIQEAVQQVGEFVFCPIVVFRRDDGVDVSACDGCPVFFPDEGDGQVEVVDEVVPVVPQGEFHVEVITSVRPGTWKEYRAGSVVDPIVEDLDVGRAQGIVVGGSSVEEGVSDVPCLAAGGDPFVGLCRKGGQREEGEQAREDAFECIHVFFVFGLIFFCWEASGRMPSFVDITKLAEFSTKQ